MKLKTPWLLTLLFLGAQLFVVSCALLDLASESPAPRPQVYPTTAPQSPRAGGQVREFRLTAGEMPYEFVKGQATKAWAYNHQVPGPELRVREGDLVRVVFTNNLPEPTTIHWHGVNVPTNMDGVPQISQDAVPPGGTFIYEFVATPAGTRWYHAHFAEHQQLRLGLYGALIIEPATAEETRYDRDYTILLGEWSPDSLHPDHNKPNGGMGGMMGGNMMSVPDDPNVKFTMNGKAFPAAQSLTVRQGERVRLRLINASAMQKHIIRLEGHTLKITHTDGNPLSPPREVDAIEMGPGERYDVEVIANQSGVWALHCVRPGHTERGLKMLLRYEGATDDGRESVDTRNTRGFRIWPDSMLAERAPTIEAARPDKQFQVTMSGGMMMSTAGEWTINGKAYPNTDPLSVKQGDRVRVRLFNMSMEDHPMHLHGHSFTVLAFGGRPITPMARDTLTVRHMESYDIEFVADNPGVWFFHCH
ncbi:MAG: multicopper oxidase family protein, partial [Chloroflexota bacterium]